MPAITETTQHEGVESESVKTKRKVSSHLPVRLHLMHATSLGFEVLGKTVIFIKKVHIRQLESGRFQSVQCQIFSAVWKEKSKGREYCSVTKHQKKDCKTQTDWWKKAKYERNAYNGREHTTQIIRRERIRVNVGFRIANFWINTLLFVYTELAKLSCLKREQESSTSLRR